MEHGFEMQVLGSHSGSGLPIPKALQNGVKLNFVPAS